jgi:hypothetical protein
MSPRLQTTSQAISSDAIVRRADGQSSLGDAAVRLADRLSALDLFERLAAVRLHHQFRP